MWCGVWKATADDGRRGGIPEKNCRRLRHLAADEAFGCFEGRRVRMTSDHDRIPEPVLDQATAWIVRLQERPDDAGLRSGHAAWVAKSAVNARAWSLTKTAWRQMGAVPTAFAHEWPPRAPGKGTRGASPPARRWPRRRLGALAAGLAACLLVVAALPSLQLRFASDHLTAVGEARQLALEDGSRVHLAPESALALGFAADRREVTLLRGEAFFEVASDPARPFVVRAEALAVTVTGTAFDIGMTARSFFVSVAEGAVRVERGGAADSVDEVELGPGEGLLIDRASGRATAVAAAPASVASWRGGRLIVEDVPLTDVVAVLDRYRRGAILILDAALREKRVTGGYDLGDPDRALRILLAPYGGRVTELTPYLVLLSGG